MGKRYIIRILQIFKFDHYYDILLCISLSQQISASLIHWNSGGLHPAIGMASVGEEVRITLNSKWSCDEETLMLVDGHEDDWSRLHDIRLSGQVI